jgi:hypothetical protein
MPVRTTITLDDDVAVELERRQKSRDASFKDVVNDTLRAGLRADERPKQRKPFRTPTVSMRPLISNFDNIAEVLAYAEGEDFK